MKNSKLLLTSALVGTVALGAVASAETKISGSATYTYASLSGSSAANSSQGAGKEVQIDISNSATLENGLGFSAGFSLEQDGTQSSFDGNEGNFMKFTSGDTSFMWNQDKAMNMSTSAVPRASTSIQTMLVGITSSSTLSSYDYSPGTQAQQSAWNMELAQKVGGGTLALVYVPQMNDQGGVNDGVGDGNVNGTSTQILYSGNMGVDGLTVKLGHETSDAIVSTQEDTKVKQIGVAYNFGSFAAGVNRNTVDQADGTDDTSTEYGVTYAVNDNMTVGLLYATGNASDTAEDEKITAIQAGYNLGALTVEAYAIQVENFQGSATAIDQEKFGIRLGTKF
jgi:outer membrane protein OmpU